MPRALTRPWLESYLDLVSMTENPHDYNVWCGISALGSILKRNVYIWFQGIQYYPNQYIILVGPPGIGKGRAIRPAIELIEEAKAANLLYDRVTAEKMIEEIADGFQTTVVTSAGAMFQKEHVATIVAKELPNFLGASDWMHTLLCQFWDENKFDHKTKNKGSNTIKELCVSLIGGCVPEYIRGLTRDKMAAITGGFTSRTIFVYGSKKSKINARGWGKPNSNLSQLQTHLINDLQHIRTLGGPGIKGEMRMSGDAMDLWDEKYKEYNTYDEFESDALTNFKARVPSHVIKTAMAISVSETDSLIIEHSHLELAATLIEQIRDNVDITFRAVGESPLAVAQDRIMRFIQARGICTRAEILRYNSRHITDEQLTSVIKVLTTIGYCTEKQVGNSQQYIHNSKMTVNIP